MFWARYEASMLGTREITCDGLLLGILREDKTVAMRVGIGALNSIRNELEQLAPATEKRVATSVDMPLSHESKRVLAFAAEEADALGHRDIDSPHLMLGLLRMENSVAAQLLRKRGMDYGQFRQIVARGERADPAPGPPAPVAPQATWPSYLVRQMYDMKQGARNGTWTAADETGGRQFERRRHARHRGVHGIAEALGHAHECEMPLSFSVREHFKGLMFGCHMQAGCADLAGRRRHDCRRGTH